MLPAGCIWNNAFLYLRSKPRGSSNLRASIRARVGWVFEIQSNETYVNISLQQQAKLAAYRRSSGWWTYRTFFSPAGVHAGPAVLIAVVAAQLMIGIAMLLAAGGLTGPFQALASVHAGPAVCRSSQLYLCSEQKCPPVPPAARSRTFRLYGLLHSPQWSWRYAAVRAFVAPQRSTHRWLRTGAFLCSFECIYT